MSKGVIESYTMYIYAGALFYHAVYVSTSQKIWGKGETFDQSNQENRRV